MVDSKRLLADLQGQVGLLEVDLAEQLAAVPGAAELLREEYDAERKAKRTAAEWPAWRDAQLTQIAVAWVLGTVFLRWSEDNGLIEPVLSGPGGRLDTAAELQMEHFRRHPEHHDGDWLAEQFEVLRTTDAGRLLFDPAHNPMYWIPVSHDAAKVLIAFWRSTDGAGLRHDFTDPDWDTRFLGDLYQDLSEDAKKRYALLQTPRFVERFILDRTLTPAIEEFGLDGLRLIDPACGSGHFLLGAFERLVRAWQDDASGLDAYEVVQRSLDSVHGVDINPFGVAIARFRLLVAALKAADVRTFDAAARQHWRPLVACTDSLRTAEKQESFAAVDEAVGYRARWEDVDDFAGECLLKSASYHVVVGNPPYITVKDPEQNEYYRKRWSASHRKYQLTVPFAQRIFDLATRPGEDGLGAGYTGQITSNAFMKREFGVPLIEQFLPSVELTHIIDTAGAYIPAHGTPTVILLGRARRPQTKLVRTALGIRGEPRQPENPEQGMVWSAIVEQIESPGSESDWVSVEDLDRNSLGTHPWVLLGGGGRDMFYRLADTGAGGDLGSRVARIGFFGVLGADDAMTAPPVAFSLRGVPSRSVGRFVIGDQVRDWSVLSGEWAIFPYDAQRELLPLNRTGIAKWLWPTRTELGGRKTFGGGTYFRDARPWFEWHQLPKDHDAAKWSVTFAFVATHNHFVLDRSGTMFNRSAPVIKLPASASEDDHLALLGVLNSSTACFWLQQISHNKGEGGGARVDAGYAAMGSEAWKNAFEFTGTKLERFPLPSTQPLGRSRHVDGLAQQLASAAPEAVAAIAIPTRNLLAAAGVEHNRLRAQLIAEQEELDWEIYQAYGLLSDAEAAEAVGDGSSEPLNLGERAFEIVLARRVAAGETDTQWFARHGSTPITELPAHWPDAYRRKVEARIALIEKRRDLALIERPECKRRWATEPWEKQQERALRKWLLDRFEGRALWFTPDANGDEQPTPLTVRRLADRLREDADVVSVAALWAGDALGRPDADLAEVVAALVDDEHVPFLPAYRYKPKGLEKRAEWEHTWALQRQEDAIAARLGHDDVTHPEVRQAIAKEIGEVPVPPKYGSGDFLRTSYWSQRGKLDVPKERFVSYPGASRDGDGSLLLGWAGWDHREQAQALAVLISQRRGDDGWSGERMTPLLAGLAEVLLWVRQWHAEVDPVHGAPPADIYDGFLDAQLGELNLSRAQLAEWRPSGRVDVSPMPRRSSPRTPSTGEPAAVRTRRPRSEPEVEHIDAVLAAASSGPLSNEQIRDLTGLDAAGARALAQHLVGEGRLVTTGQRRGMRYLLA